MWCVLTCQTSHAPLFPCITWLSLALLSMLLAEYVDTTKDEIAGLKEHIAQRDAQQQDVERRAAELQEAQETLAQG